MDTMKLRTDAEKVRQMWDVGPTAPLDIFTIVHSLPDVTLILYPFGEHVSGLCVKLTNSAVIAINSTQTLGRQRFSLAHEIYHYYFDEQNTTTFCTAQIGLGSIEEKKADFFASNLLVPPLALMDQVTKLRTESNKPLAITDVVYLEQYFQVSRKAILYRLVKENLITSDESKKMETHVKATASALGYNLALYEQRSVESQKTTLGYYVKEVERLYNNNKLSTVKYEEMLLDAYRSDVVYGLESEGKYVD